MTGRAIDTVEPTTLVVACCDEHAYPAHCRAALRDHAIVLRPYAHSALLGPGGPAAAALSTRPIRRVIVMSHTRCRARAGRDAAEPFANTAAVTAWCRYAEPARRLATRLGAAEITPERFGAQLDALVRMANLRSCPQVHDALEGGRVELYGVVYDVAADRLSIFDDVLFRPIDHERLRRLIAGGATTGSAIEPDPVPQTYPPVEYAHGAAPEHAAH